MVNFLKQPKSTFKSKVSAFLYKCDNIHIVSCMRKLLF